MVGAAFAFGWTPCIGPVLGSIIALSVTEETVMQGVILKAISSGFYMNRFLVSKKGFGKYFKRISITGGLILLLTGVLIVTNQIQVISFFILTHFPFLTTLG